MKAMKETPVSGGRQEYGVTGEESRLEEGIAGTPRNT